MKWFTEENGVVAILDATNSTKTRRQWIVDKCKQYGLRLMFVESVCDNKELVTSNIMDVKVSSPDYMGLDPEKVNSLPTFWVPQLIGRLYWIFEIGFGCMRKITRRLKNQN